MNNIATQTQDEAYHQIMRLMKPVPVHMKSRVQTNSKQITKKIKSIISQHVGLKNNTALVNEIFKFTESNRGQEGIRQFRRKLLSHYCIKNGILRIAKDIFIPDDEKNSLIHQCKQDSLAQIINGTLSVPEEKLKNYQSNEFWNIIKEEKVTKLAIHKKEGTSIFYDGLVLSKLIEIKPSPVDLPDEYTLEFDTGTIRTFKARLLACGDYFKRALDNDVKETSTKTIFFEDSALEDITRNGFLGILGVVETGELDPAIDKKEFREAVKYLLLEDLPRNHSVFEEVYGQDIWEKYWGKIDPAMPLPKEAFEPCPINNKEKKVDGSRMIDTHVFIWMAPKVDGKCLTVDSIEEMATSEKFGNNTKKFAYMWPSMREDQEINKPLEQGYWFAMLKSPLKETANMNFDAQKQYLEDNLPHGYDFSTIRETLLYRLMPHACSDALVLEQQDPSRYETRCRESNGLSGHVFIGSVGARPGRLCVYSSDGAHRGVCVVPSLRFF